MTPTSLRDHLATFIPQGIDLDFFHISTPPTLCPALFAPPPGLKPVKTYCEQHLLKAVHVVDAAVPRRIALFAIEIYIYTTSSLTTIFVSKADSTGFAHLLKLPQGHRSLSKTLASAFVDFLVHNRTRKDRKLNVSLFARAQGQYLFPGSVDHGGKHVLSDRGLVKWWCNTLDPILRKHPHPKDARSQPRTASLLASQGYLIVPGHDRYETTAFLPVSARADPQDARRWKNDHPLREMTSYPGAAPRSIVPHFPDDPKSRFLLDLDDELVDAVPSGGEHRTQPSPSKRGTGQWRSVKTLDQFWDMMSYRQECSSGRLVGFLWITFNPVDMAFHDSSEAPPSPTLRPRKRKFDKMTEKPAPAPKKKKRSHNSYKTKSGFIPIRKPRVKSAEQSTRLPAEKTVHWYWPVGGRGTIIVPEKDYERIIRILHRLDFASVDAACTSTEKWAKEAGVIAGVTQAWAARVSGAMAVKPISQPETSPTAGSAVNALNTGLVRKKEKPSSQASDSAPAATNLTGLVRKKAK